MDDLVSRHRVLSGPARQTGVAERLNVVHARRGGAFAHLLVRTDAAAEPLPQGWECHPVGLEELTLAYLREPAAAMFPGPARTPDAMPAEVAK